MDLGGVKAKPFVSEEEGEEVVGWASAIVRELARRVGL
jgi:hypothetical protein